MKRRKHGFYIFCLSCILASTGCAAAPFGSKTIDSKCARIERISKIFRNDISRSITNDDEYVGKIPEKRKNDSPTFGCVALVAALNVYINIAREDGDIPFALRVPRLMWETSIIATTMLVRWVKSPILHLLLAIILGTTGLVDMVFWSPYFALNAEFEFNSEFDGSTNGFCVKHVSIPHLLYSWEKGYGRLMVSAQSLFGGMFYLAAALQAWYEFIRFRDRQDIARQYLVLDAIKNNQEQEGNNRQIKF